jgi:hypothetical protein
MIFITLFIFFIYSAGLIQVEASILFGNPLFYIGIVFGVIGIGLLSWFWVWFFISFRNLDVTPWKSNSKIYKEIANSSKTAILNNDIKNEDYEKNQEIELEKNKRLISPQMKISILREYEFIGGQIRFKVGLVNNSHSPLTDIIITFNIPNALRWIIHEPYFNRKGDSIYIPKLGANEKKAISLYLEPINCMKSPINATVSYHDENDQINALTMPSKKISITCPIFFTEIEANFARVKNLQLSLTHRDKKIYPVVNPENSGIIFSSILSELGKFDIKLVTKEFSEEYKFGEAWYFGITKIKKNRMVMQIILNGKSKTLEIEVSGNEEDQITAFLAEIGDRIRRQLLEKKVITSQERFNDMRIFILSNKCPICYEAISEVSVQKFLEGEGIKCENCYARIPKIPIFVRKVKKLKWLYQNNEGGN